MELGANIGLNLHAFKCLLPHASLAAVEINTKAAEICRQIDGVEVYEESILDFSVNKKWDITFTSGVLIHISPEYLGKVYECLYKHSKRYILVSEYYNPVPMEINYRGNREKMYKRDFAGELMDKYTDLRLVQYGFKYHRDNNFPDDDLTWFLMEKNNI